MVQAIIIVLIFLLVVALMISRKLPTVLAMPVLAIGIALVAGIPFFEPGETGDTGILTGVIESGTIRLASSYAAVIFGAWLGEIMMSTGITKRTVKMAAELGGDRPLVVTILLMIATAILFTTVGGLGATIMIGSIVLPIMTSIGVTGLTAVCLFLFSMGMGLTLNVANWNFYLSVLQIDKDTVQTFSLILLSLTVVMAIIFLFIEYKRNGFGAAWPQGNNSLADEDSGNQKVPAISLITPLIPIIMVIVFDWPIIPAFIVAILFSLLVTQKSVRAFINILSKTAYDGVTNVAPVIILMMGIGMLLNAVMHPKVSAIMSPLLESIIPSDGIGFILFFAILSPLALYRGPLNMWGLGSGIGSLIISLGILPAPAVMGALLSTERVQVIADPTNTHNVWLANYAGVDVNQVLRKVLPYVWVLSAIGVIVAYFMFL